MDSHTFDGFLWQSGRKKVHQSQPALNHLENRLHILIVSAWYPTNQSSAGTFIEEFILALNSRNIRTGTLISEEVTFGNFLRKLLKGSSLLNYRKHPDILAIENLTVHSTPLRWAADSKSKRFSNILKRSKRVLDRYIAKHGKPDIIFHHGIFDFTYITRFLSETYEIPYWFKEHSSYIEKDNFPRSNDFETDEGLKDFVQNAERRFAPSGFYAEKMSAIFEVGFEVMHNTLNDNHFTPISEFPKDHFLFLNIAVKSPAKNQQLLVRAFHRAFGNGSGGESLVIAGDGELHDALVSQVKQLGMGNRISVLNFQDRAEIDQLLAQCSVFVLASNLETFGVVLIEAMAKGIPVVSSRIPGPMDIVHERNGIFFEAGDEKSLAEALIRMKGTYRDYDRQAIQAEIGERYGPDSIAGVFLNSER